jgi:hypothetical protein
MVETTEKCIYQAFKSRKSEIPSWFNTFSKFTGDGKCPGCAYDPENNKRCSNYYGVTLHTIDVK